MLSFTASGNSIKHVAFPSVYVYQSYIQNCHILLSTTGLRCLQSQLRRVNVYADIFKCQASQYYRQKLV